VISMVKYIYTFLTFGLMLGSVWGDETSTGFARGGAVFLKLPSNARSASLGGAMTAWSSNGYGKQYNPALINGIRGFQGRGMYAKMPLDQIHQSVSASYRFHDFVAGDVTYIGYGVGEIERRDDLGNLEGHFDFLDNTITLALASHWKNKLAFGIRGRYVGSKLDKALAYGYGLDLGILYKPYSFLSIGLSGLNLGSEIIWSTGHRDPILPEGRVGLFLTFLNGDLSFSGDVENTQYQPVDGAVAAEYIIFKTIAARVGVSYFHDPDYSFGTGVMYNKWITRS